MSCLKALGERESNPNSRYYYLSSAALLDDNYQPNDLLAPTLEVVKKYPIEAMLESLKVSVVPEKSIDKNIHLLFSFTDSGKKFSLFLRKGVLEIQPFEVAGSSVQVIATEEDMKAVLTGLKSLPISLVTGSIKVNGSKADLLSLFSSVGS
jgi:alkyl sulfatase BDS1-like metallo-beta-lactamase superfamily hydrolase